MERQIDFSTFANSSIFTLRDRGVPWDSEGHFWVVISPAWYPATRSLPEERLIRQGFFAVF